MTRENDRQKRHHSPSDATADSRYATSDTEVALLPSFVKTLLVNQHLKS